jgi:protein-tyrosine phosphatase
MRVEIYWIEGAWPGRLAIMPRPRGGDWLEDELRDARRQGVDTLVSLLTPEETDELDLADEPALCERGGMDFINHPIPDRGVPASRQAFADLAVILRDRLRAGKSVAIHCRQGVGRSALLTACVQVLLGVTEAEGWRRISATRKCPVPDTEEQRAWVSRFASEYFSLPASHAGG